MNRLYVPIVVFVMLLQAIANAQISTAGRPGEHLGAGGTAAVGFPGPMMSLRFSGPLSDRVGVDLDVGGAREGARHIEGWGLAFGAQVRWLRRERQTRGASDYVIFGLLVMDATSVTDIRFPDHQVLNIDRQKRLTPQVGYGFDWQDRDGTRLGIEFLTGGSEAAGPRIFARFFAVWGPQIRVGGVLR